MNSVENKTVILIAGMHRSGTSMLARLLNLHGVHLPLDRQRADEFNERGYWENFGVVAFNDRLMAAAGQYWTDIRPYPLDFMQQPEVQTLGAEVGDLLDEALESGPYPVAFKDPRLCRLLPFWLEQFHARGCEVVAILPFRHPVEVAASLQAREGFSDQHVFDLWTRYMLEAERGTRHLKRVFCSYDRMLSDWPEVFQSLRSRLGLISLKDWESAREEVEAFQSQDLRHWSQGNDTEKAAGHAGVLEAFALIKSAEREPGADLSEGFDRALERLDQLTGADIPADALSAELRLAKLQNAELSQQNVRLAQFHGQLRLLERELKSISESWSWRVTKPLRAVFDLLGGKGR